MRSTYLFTIFLLLQGTLLSLSYFFHPVTIASLEAGVVSLLAAVPMLFAELHAAAVYRHDQALLDFERTKWGHLHDPK